MTAENTEKTPQQEIGAETVEAAEAKVTDFDFNTIHATAEKAAQDYNTAYVSSRTLLYTALARAYQMFHAAVLDTDGFKKWLEEDTKRQESFTGDTVQSKIISGLFGFITAEGHHRQRVSQWSHVLVRMTEAEPPREPNDVAGNIQWIKENGGVDKLANGERPDPKPINAELTKYVTKNAGNFKEVKDVGDGWRIGLFYDGKLVETRDASNGVANDFYSNTIMPRIEAATSLGPLKKAIQDPASLNMTRVFIRVDQDKSEVLADNPQQPGQMFRRTINTVPGLEAGKTYYAQIDDLKEFRTETLQKDAKITVEEGVTRLPTREVLHDGKTHLAEKPVHKCGAAEIGKATLDIKDKARIKDAKRMNWTRISASKNGVVLEVVGLLRPNINLSADELNLEQTSVNRVLIRSALISKTEWKELKLVGSPGDGALVLIGDNTELHIPFGKSKKCKDGNKMEFSNTTTTLIAA